MTDPKRGTGRTGRTTRMLVDAFFKARGSDSVIVVMATTGEIVHATALFEAVFNVVTTDTTYRTRFVVNGGGEVRFVTAATDCRGHRADHVLLDHHVMGYLREHVSPSRVYKKLDEWSGVQGKPL